MAAFSIMFLPFLAYHMALMGWIMHRRFVGKSFKPKDKETSVVEDSTYFKGRWNRFNKT